MIKKIAKYIEIAGYSNPRFNIMPLESQFSMLEVLRKHYMKVELTIVNNLADLKKLAAKQPDLVIPGMKIVLPGLSKGYEDSPKLWLSDYLKGHGISFTGSDTEAFEFEYDKHLAKQAVADAGLNTPNFFISSVKKPQFKHNLKYPLFVKPINLGDSKGIDELSLVHNHDQLKNKIVDIHKTFNSDVLIEEYLPGREFSVAVIRQRSSDELIAMPIEITIPIDKNGNKFLSQSVKEADTEESIAVTDNSIRQAINQHAIDVFKVLQSRDYGRIDIRLDAQGEPHFIEANLMPGLSDHGYLYNCFKFNGYASYDDMILSIVGLALERKDFSAVSGYPSMLNPLQNMTPEISSPIGEPLIPG